MDSCVQHFLKQIQKSMCQAGYQVKLTISGDWGKRVESSNQSEHIMKPSPPSAKKKWSLIFSLLKVKIKYVILS